MHTTISGKGFFKCFSLAGLVDLELTGLFYANNHPIQLFKDMAVLPLSEPSAYRLAYNDNVYVFKSTTPTTTKRFKVYVLPEGSLTPIATLIVHPTPAGTITDRAFVDVSKVLQSKLTHDISIPSANHSAFFINENSHYEYVVGIQEQDLDANSVYQNEGQIYFYDLKSVWNGVQDLVDWLDFDPSEYLLDTGAGSHKFLTDGPTGTDYRDIGSSESASLFFIATENDAPAGYYITTYDDYNAQGTQLSNVFVDNLLASSISTNHERRYFRIPVGTYDIPLTLSALYSSGSPSTILNGVKSYTIRLWDNSFPISEPVTFNIDRNCTKYTPIRLHWMNKLGGFDAFNFDLKSEEVKDVDRRNYHQQHRTFTGAGWSYDKMDRGRTEYATQSTKKIRVNTGYLTDVESEWMWSLFDSPIIYQEVNNELIAVNIDGRSVPKKTELNDKLRQFTFDIEYSLKNHRQRG